MRKLWIEAPADFALAVHGERAGGGKRPAPSMRVMFWPSGKVCWQVNMYLVELRKRNLATSTVNTYGSELSRLLRFLHGADLRIEEMHDEQLIGFADYLVRPPDGRGVTANHANRLVLRAIGFLSWLQLRLPSVRLVGVDGEGAQISLTIRQQRSRHRASQVHHPALVARNVRREVRPITGEALRGLQRACRAAAKTEFVIARNGAMLTMLSDSGVRREELVWMRAHDIEHALDRGGRLDVRTAKRRGNPTRQVPVPVETLRAVRTFLDVHRRLQIRRLAKRDRTFVDEGWAFCTRSGGQLAPASVTQIVADLREAANLKQRANPHMFRHRWITLQLRQMLGELQDVNSYGVQMLTTVLSRLASITGHASLDSLWTYVDWTFDEAWAVESTPDTARGGEYLNLTVLPALISEILGALREDSDLDALRARLVEFRDRVRDEAALPDPKTETVAAHSLRRKEWR
ncbi:hypothetical protein CKO44_15775 [Rubrivivax gelatinosus]|uniref:tyrosine-type recombinase/integrase n=1 Tax=Rubrivivax gelatinosus TaxID=28068 RepID=UPI001906D0FC|nr:site-specific integrase [Rubrivivax gelatinosus]MBK1614928.1 hypothetical protein [Rubrivivax gelatinosus]MBZ8143230.1 site-specific recombinase [Rubrivivax gelatinosus]